MLYRFLADAVLLVHLGFIVFVVFGALLAARYRILLPVHLAAATWGIAVEVSGAGCPLTGLENQMRLLAGQSGYAESFVEHYLLALIYPGALTREIQYWLAAGVLTINLALYCWILRRRRTSSRAQKDTANIS